MHLPSPATGYRPFPPNRLDRIGIVRHVRPPVERTAGDADLVPGSMAEDGDYR